MLNESAQDKKDLSQGGNFMFHSCPNEFLRTLFTLYFNVAMSTIP